MQALGIVDVLGIASAIVSADTALKAANVQLTKIEKIKGGIVTVILRGDVGAINAAIDSIENNSEVNSVISKHVIARPEAKISSLLENDIKLEEEIEKEIEVTNESLDIIENTNKEEDTIVINETKVQDINIKKETVKKNKKK